MSNCCCLLCVKNIIREKDLPRTGRTFGNAISKLGSAGKRRATLNSHEIPPWRFLLQRASHSRASCTSRQVIFPFTGHVSQTIVNAMIQLISMYVIRFPCTMFSSSRFIYFSFFFFFEFRYIIPNTWTKTTKPRSSLFRYWAELYDQRFPFSSPSFSSWISAL